MKRVVLTLIFTLQFSIAQADGTRVGTTFSPVQCKYFQMDWRSSCSKIMGMDFDVVRIGAYWDRIEKVEGIFDFSELDLEVREAARNGRALVITVGMKAPRWPEYHIPSWLLDKTKPAYGEDIGQIQLIRESVLVFIGKVVRRYRSEKTVICWQVENEALDRMGSRKWYIGKDLLAEEVKVVRELDGKGRPILLTVAAYPNKAMRFMAALTTPHDPVAECAQVADIVGVNVYPVVGHAMWTMKWTFRSGEKEREQYFRRFFGRIKQEGKEVWVTELQAEPWEPGQLVHTGSAPAKTVSPAGTALLFAEIKSLGVRTILLWGAEYWLYRENRFRDDTWMNMVSGLIREQ